MLFTENKAVNQKVPCLVLLCEAQIILVFSVCELKQIEECPLKYMTSSHSVTTAVSVCTVVGAIVIL